MLFASTGVTLLAVAVFGIKSDGVFEFLFATLGAAIAAHGIDGLRTGTVRVRCATVSRDTSPVMFWFSLVAYIFIGLVVLALGVWSAVGRAVRDD